MNLYKLFADNLLSNMYETDTSVEIHPEYLRAGSKEEIFQNFMHYRNAVKEMFVNISKTVKDTPISSNVKFNAYIERQEDRDARDSVAIPMRCVFAALYIIGNCGVLREDCIIVDKKTFRQHFVKVRKEHIQQALAMLSDNGFLFDCDIYDKGSEFEVTYPDNPAVLSGLASFARTIILSRTIGWGYFVAACSDYGKVSSFILMNTHLYQWRKDEEKPFEFYDLFRFLDKQEEKNALKKFHEKMLEQGYSFRFDLSTFFVTGASVRYQLGPNEPYALMRVNEYDRKAYIGIKMLTLKKYTDYIQQCSTAFKDGFDKLWVNCTGGRCYNDMENCECRVRYTNGDKSYDKCTGNTGRKNVYVWEVTVLPLNEADIDSYIYFITQKYKKSTGTSNQPNEKPSDKLSPYDREKFTLDAFRPQLKKNNAVIAVCGTSVGFMDVQRDFMHEALFRSKIHPKTKASKLTDKEIENLYNKIIEVAGEIQASKKINKAVHANVIGKPCPVCGELIEKGSAFGSTFYICPGCQKEKNLKK